MILPIAGSGTLTISLQYQSINLPALTTLFSYRTTAKQSVRPANTNIHPHLRRDKRADVIMGPWGTQRHIPISPYIWHLIWLKTINISQKYPGDILNLFLDLAVGWGKMDFGDRKQSWWRSSRAGKARDWPSPRSDSTKQFTSDASHTTVWSPQLATPGYRIACPGEPLALSQSFLSLIYHKNFLLFVFLFDSLLFKFHFRPLSFLLTLPSPACASVSRIH